MNAFFKILQNSAYLFFAPRRDVKRDNPLGCVYRSHHGDTIIAFKNKFYKGDFPTIDPVVLLYCFQSFSECITLSEVVSKPHLPA